MSDARLLEDLTGIAVGIVKEMKNIIKLNGAFATGNLYNSVKYKVYKDKSEKFHLDVDYVYYGLWIDMGRKPGKQPPLREIQEWCRIKGIPQEAAFPIARKIGRFGFKGINFTKPFEKAYKNLPDELILQFGLDVDNLFNFSIKQPTK